MRLLCLLIIFMFASVQWLQAQTSSWVHTWESMEADTHKLRFLHQELRTDRTLAPDSISLLALQGYELAAELGDLKGIGAMRLYQGLGLVYQSEYQSAIPFFEESIQAYLAIRDSSQAGAVSINLGLLFDRIGKTEHALKKYLEASTYLKESTRLPYLYNNVAIIYRKQGNYHRAREYYGYALEIRRKQEDSLGMAAVWFNLANLNLLSGDTLLAEKQARNAYTIYHQNEQQRELATSQALLGSIYLRSGKQDKALSFLREAWHYYQTNLHEEYALVCAGDLANLLTRQNEPGQAAYFYEEAIKMAHQRDARDELLPLLQSYSTLLRDQGDYSKAIDSLLRAFHLQKQLTDRNRLQLVAEMQARFEVEQAESREKLQAEAFATKERLNRIILLLAGALLLIIAIFAWVNLRKNRTLQHQQILLEEALNNKEAVMREMHHRIKNNLQFLSSLLRLQARQLDDPGMKEVLMTSRNRVLSMAQVHTYLYRGESQTAIHMKPYLTQMAQDILDSFHSPEKKIELKMTIAPIVLDVDQAIPLALITHEGVANAMKYAFIQRTTGIVKIDLSVSENHGILRIKDDGVGGTKGKMGFGHKLMALLAERLNGELDIRFSMGLQVGLEFPLENIRYAEG